MPKDWPALDRQHVWHPYTQMQTAPAPIPIERAEGVWLHTREGRKVLDGISSWWVNIHGHSHPRLTRALAEQAARLQQVVFAGLTHEPAACLARELIEMAASSFGPGHFERVFYSDDGSTAVEVALKLAAQHHAHRGKPERRLFVAFTDAYHGDTFGAMAAGGVEVFHRAFAPWLFEVRRAYGPACYGDPEDPSKLTRPHRRRKGGGDGSLEEILAREGDRVAAVIIEPMLQGAGGMIVSPPEFLRRARELATRHGALLIADEVFTGFGRTGRMLASEHGPVVPDLVCLSKAITGGYLPLAATLASPAIYESFLDEDRSRAFFHGHSYTANALACAVALESLAIFREERVLDRIVALESLFRARLEGLASHPLVRATRGIGALAALEVGRAGGAAESEGYLDPIGPRVYDALLRRDVLLRPLGDVVYFLPPYCVTDAEAHAVFDAIESALDEIESARDETA